MDCIRWRTRWVTPERVMPETVKVYASCSSSRGRREEDRAARSREIRDIAVDLLCQLRRSFPELFDHFGPACFSEGRGREPPPLFWNPL